jgi:hypothetical protein
VDGEGEGEGEGDAMGFVLERKEEMLAMERGLIWLYPKEGNPQCDM